MEGARQGDPEALGHVLEACRPYLLLVARQELRPDLRPKVDASDLVQETYLKVQQNLAQFQGRTEAELLGWLRRILLNTLANVSRHYQTEGRDRAREAVLDTDNPLAAFENGVLTPAPSPRSELLAREQDEQLGRALAALPEDYRQVIHLRQWERLSFEEVGRRLGRSAPAARKLWARAIKQLKQLLEPPDASA
jgi:RNA polymerase sigma-70 factor (ECF subfamily)